MKRILFVSLNVMLCMVISTHVLTANKVIIENDIVIFKAVSNPSITFELKENSSFIFKQNGDISIALDIKKKGVTKDKGAILHYYDIIGVPEFKMLSIADMREVSPETRKKNFGITEEIMILVKGVEQKNDLLVGVELVAGSLTESTSEEKAKAILFPPEQIKKDLSSFFWKLDNGFKQETTGSSDFYYGAVDSYTFKKGFISDEEGTVLLVREQYAGLWYSFDQKAAAQLIISLINYSDPTFSLENIKENPENLIFIVKKNGTPIGFCELTKYKENAYNFFIVELIDVSKLEASVKESWQKLETNPTALQGKLVESDGREQKYKTIHRAFAAKDASLLVEDDAHSIINEYAYYSPEALIYLIKRMDITVSVRSKKVITDQPSKYLEVHSTNNNYYGIVVGEVDGKSIIQLIVRK